MAVMSEPSPAGEASLELDGLRRRFGTVTALDGLTFGVPPGQVFGFLGPNGAGKTTRCGPSSAWSPSTRPELADGVADPRK